MANRDIAGQFDSFLFAQASPAGVSDLEEQFKTQWASQIQTAANVLPGGAGQYFMFPEITVRDIPDHRRRVGGAEHLGVSFGGANASGAFGSIYERVAAPDGKPIAVCCSIATILQFVDTIWTGLFLPYNGYLDEKFNPNPDGPFQLRSLTIAGADSQDTLQTTIAGIYHTYPGLPDVPFTVTQIERVLAQKGQIVYSVEIAVDTDTSALMEALQAVEGVVGIVAITLSMLVSFGFLLLPFIAVGIGVGVITLDDYIRRKKEIASPAPIHGGHE